ncbi:MAG: histone-like nucleoid-structuring protein Lsr2 [Streptomycetales bacterium]
MAQKVEVILVDDLEGGAADETVSFSLDGVSYDIDLNSENADRLRDVLAPFVASGRRVGGRAQRGRGRGRGRRDAVARTPEIRKWAKSQGYEVSDRGRVPAHIVEEYDKAHR